jgi:iron complex outermembrane receptor protein
MIPLGGTGRSGRDDMRAGKAKTTTGLDGAMENGTRHKRLLACTLLISTALALTALDTAAQTPGDVSRLSYDIPAQSLSSALVSFSDRTGLQLFFDAGLVRGKMSPGIKGTMTRSEALGHLLASSDLLYRVNGETVTITDAAAMITGSTGGDGTTLDTIVVDGKTDRLGPVVGYVARNGGTSTKTNTALVRTPQSISVITKEQAAAQGAQSLTQALRYSAGVSAEVRGSASRYDLPYIRGFGSPTDSNQYVDGLRMLRGGGYAIPQIETYGLERLEFLKGPASTLYGGVNPGGMINTVSKTPTETPQREIELLYGSHDRMQLGFDFSGPVNDEGTLLYRLVGLGRQSDTQVINTEEERLYIAPSVTWAPDSDTSLTVSASYQSDPEGGFYGVLPTVGSLWANPAGIIPRWFNDGDPGFDEFDRKQATIGYQFEHRFNDTWTVRHNLRYLDHTTVTKALGTASLAADGHTINRYALGTDESVSGFTSDLQLQAEFDTGALRHTTLFGFDYQDSEWNQIRDYGVAPPISFLNPNYGTALNLALTRITDQTQTTRQSGFYVQDQVEWDNWTMVAGGRYDLVRTVIDNHLTGGRSAQDDEALSGKLGLIYNFDNGLAPYLSYSTSFLPVTGTDANGNAFTPTTARQWEVGVKYEPTAFDGLFTLAFFDIVQKDVVSYQSPLINYQTGEQRARGIEFEAKVAVTNSINLTGAFSYTKAEVSKGLGVDVGNYPIGVPDYTASLWADYSFNDGTLEGLKVGSGVRYVGKTVGGYSPNVYTPGATVLDVPGYTVFDTALSYDFGKKSPELEGLTAKLTINNLFDKSYVTCLSNNFCNYGNGRAIYGSLAYRW